MIVIVEGIDRVGKTTLCNMLVDEGFKYFKDVYFDGVPITRKIASEKLRTTLEFLKLFKDENIVVDRLHITEFAYGALERNYTSSEVEFIDKELALLDAVLILVNPINAEDLDRASRVHGKDLTIHNSIFNTFYKVSSIKRKHICDFNSLDFIVERLTERPVVHASPKVYFAAPFFTPEQIEREEWLIYMLRMAGFDVFSPRENILLSPNATQEEREKAFRDNIHEINNSDLVFAVTDGKDMGTIWEAGYAYGVNKPIVYYNETLGPEGKFNVMLAQSGCLTILGRDGFPDGEVRGRILDALNGKFTSYAGAIE